MRIKENQRKGRTAIEENGTGRREKEMNLKLPATHDLRTCSRIGFLFSKGGGEAPGSRDIDVHSVSTLNTGR